ncbi:hypothetical protein [Mesorhizobium sp. Root157]|uniref:hypothetical protein n=1 Tax=Mesorhizobium sp. Root157 TaxID=1736477 RepID=UPI000A988172|nr:hypothetical protein [Mesorhizobium sp. Root157]
MQHVRRTIEDLRRYIVSCDSRAELEEVDTLLAVALEEVRRKIKEKESRHQPGS